MLADCGIVYAPDYLVNSGGVIQVADELHGFNFERAKARAEQIFATTRQILAAADTDGRSARGRRGPAGRAPDRRGRPARGHIPGQLITFSGISGGAYRPKQVRLYLYVRASASGLPVAEWRRVSLVCTNREHWRGNGQLRVR